MTAKLQTLSTSAHFGTWGEVHYRMRCDECKISGQSTTNDIAAKTDVLAHNSEEHA